jgi:hypothetical protein
LNGPRPIELLNVAYIPTFHTNVVSLTYHPDKPEMNNQLKEATLEMNRGMTLKTTPAPMKSRHQQINQQNKHKPTPMMKKFRIQLSAQVNLTSGEWQEHTS